jgi:hypothetical protein
LGGPRGMPNGSREIGSVLHRVGWPGPADAIRVHPESRQAPTHRVSSPVPATRCELCASHAPVGSRDRSLVRGARGPFVRCHRRDLLDSNRPSPRGGVADVKRRPAHLVRDWCIGGAHLSKIRDARRARGRRAVPVSSDSSRTGVYQTGGGHRDGPRSTEPTQVRILAGGFSNPSSVTDCHRRRGPRAAHGGRSCSLRPLLLAKHHDAVDDVDAQGEDGERPLGVGAADR